MSSQQNATNLHLTSRLSLEMGKRLHAAAGRDIKNKLSTGEVKIVDGRYVGECLKVKRPSKCNSRLG